MTKEYMYSHSLKIPRGLKDQLKSKAMQKGISVQELGTKILIDGLREIP